MQINPISYSAYNKNYLQKAQNKRADIVSFSGGAPAILSKCAASVETSVFKDPILFDGRKFSELLGGKPKEMFDKLGIKILNCKDGLLTISKYEDSFYTSRVWMAPAQFQIDEDALFKYIRRIQGAAIFEHSNLTNLGNVESIGGDAVFSFSKVNRLGKLKDIGGHAAFTTSQITDLENLEHIGAADFQYSCVKRLGNLKKVDRKAYVDDGNPGLRTKLENRGINCESSSVLIW